MAHPFLLLTLLCVGQTETLGPGDHVRAVSMDKQRRTYIVHVPSSYDARKPMPVVLALHGLGMNAKLMQVFTGLDKTADAAGFIVVYPNGSGPGGVLLAWNAGAFLGDERKERPDDVEFLGKVLDDVEATWNVDRKRVYVTGMSNGAMMAYRLASALSERIAAIAPIAGTMADNLAAPKRPVPVIHFHGTDDGLVPYFGPGEHAAKVVHFRSVDDTIKTWAKFNGCENEPTVTELPMPADKLKVTRKAYNKCRDGADVVLYEVSGGGHTWPGRHFHARFLGETTDNISANDLMWEFFRQHPLK